MTNFRRTDRQTFRQSDGQTFRQSDGQTIRRTDRQTADGKRSDSLAGNRAENSEELYGLTSQIWRATTSISLNIAEGSGNNSEKEFKRFLEIALRSAYEVMACLEIALKLTYLKRRILTDSSQK